MTEIYDMVLMVGDLVLILMFFWFIAEIGSFFLDEFSGASARIIQEFVSGYLSMSNFAPAVFFVEETFPAVNHMMKVYESPPLVSIKVGTQGSAYLNSMTGEQKTNVTLSFVQKPPLSYFLSDSIVLTGDCLDNFCTFSRENKNKIGIGKDENYVSILLNREFTRRGILYKLGEKIFHRKCDSKLYDVDYLFAGITSIRVQVKEDGQIIKEGPNPTIEIMIGETKTINNLKITLYSLDTVTNVASITTKCA